MPAAQGIKRPELRDELYMQLLKQSRGNTTPSCAKVTPLAEWTVHDETRSLRTCMRPFSSPLGLRAAQVLENNCVGMLRSSSSLCFEMAL